MIRLPRVTHLVPAALLVLVGLPAGLVVAQSQGEAPRDEAPGERFDDRVEVRLVEVDVRVTDDEGELVEGLEADDFRLSVDGEEREIEYFTAVSAGALLAAGEDDEVAATEAVESARAARRSLPRLSPDPASQERYLVVYVDRHFLDPAELDRARLALQEFLRQDVPPGTRVMVATGDDTLRVLQRFTTEPALVADTVDAMELPEGRAAWRRQYDLAMREIHKLHDVGRSGREGVAPRSLTDWRNDREGEARRAERGQGPRNPGGDFLNQGEDVGRAELAQSDPRLSLQMIEEFEQRVEARINRSAASLGRMLRAMSGLRGEKTLLYVGGTLPSNAARTLFELWQDTYGNLADQADAVGRSVRKRGFESGIRGANLERAETYGRSIELVEQVAQLANAADVTIHGLDVAVKGRLGRSARDVEHHRSGADMGGIVSSDTRLGRRPDSGISMLADRTGGRSEYQRRFEDFFAGVRDHLRGRYVLAFTAEVADPDGEARDGGKKAETPDDGVREIEIELRDRTGERKRYALHHRRGVAVKSLEQETREQTLAALAMDVSAANPLEIEVAAGEPVPGGDGEAASLPLSVKVPMAGLALVPDQQAHAGRLSIYVAVGDLGREVAMAKSEVPVRIPNRDLLTAFGRTVDYRLQVAAPPGAQRVAVTVRDEYRPSDSTVTARLGSLETTQDETTGSTEGGL